MWYLGFWIAFQIRATADFRSLNFLSDIRPGMPFQTSIRRSPLASRTCGGRAVPRADFDAMLAGRLDLYPEYTGTSYTAILHHQPITDPRAVYEQVKAEYGQKFGIAVSDPLG